MHPHRLVSVFIGDTAYINEVALRIKRGRYDVPERRVIHANLSGGGSPLRIHLKANVASVLIVAYPEIPIGPKGKAARAIDFTWAFARRCYIK
jgi:hypothetical protein